MVNTILTARSRSSGEYLLGRDIGSILSRNGPSDKPGTIHGCWTLIASFGSRGLRDRYQSGETGRLSGAPPSNLRRRLTNGRASKPTTCERNPNETGGRELIEPGSVRGGPPQRRGHRAPFDFGGPLRDILAIES